MIFAVFVGAGKADGFHFCAYGFDKIRYLLLCQPHGLSFQPHLKPDRIIRLVEIISFFCSVGVGSSFLDQTFYTSSIVIVLSRSFVSFGTVESLFA